MKKLRKNVFLTVNCSLLAYLENTILTAIITPAPINKKRPPSKGTLAGGIGVPQNAMEVLPRTSNKITIGLNNFCFDMIFLK